MGFQGVTAYLLVFIILLACGFGIPIPEDIILIGAGALAYYGAADVGIMIAVCFAGVMIGDGIVFCLGKRLGPNVARHRIISRFLTQERLAEMSKVVQSKGDKILFAARFMPGLRSPLFFTAGTLGVKFRTFLLFDGLAALISVPAIVYAVYYFGHQLEEVIKMIRFANFGVLGVIFCLALVAIIKWRLKRRGVQ
jgi:membrane protein DedA with SNARE-associated domain